MFMRETIVLFVSLGFVYALCVLANKEKGLLKTVGYALSASIFIASLVYAFLVSETESLKGRGAFNPNLLVKRAPTVRR